MRQRLLSRTTSSTSTGRRGAGTPSIRATSSATVWRPATTTSRRTVVNGRSVAHIRELGNRLTL
ncbi:hypothetical protein [Amycolatopsis sp. NPDC098790]|uniref:hypothetical protein n=1 Tax=Amycolatopsis sp. NPDC098790 TaxID=3363939 RepID=UPI00381CA26D